MPFNFCIISGLFWQTFWNLLTVSWGPWTPVENCWSITLHPSSIFSIFLKFCLHLSLVFWHLNVLCFTANDYCLYGTSQTASLVLSAAYTHFPLLHSKYSVGIVRFSLWTFFLVKYPACDSLSCQHSARNFATNGPSPPEPRKQHGQ